LAVARPAREAAVSWGLKEVRSMARAMCSGWTVKSKRQRYWTRADLFGEAVGLIGEAFEDAVVVAGHGGATAQTGSQAVPRMSVE
jgi:hypothetical protein